MRDVEETNDESKERVKDGMAAKKKSCKAKFVQCWVGTSVIRRKRTGVNDRNVLASTWRA